MDTARPRIKQALVTLLEKYEFSKISVTQICSRAGLSRVTFYIWYESKEALLDDYFQDIVNEGNEYYQNLLAKSSGRASELKRHYHALANTIFYLSQRYYSFMVHVFDESGREDQVLYDRYHAIVMKKVRELMNGCEEKIAPPLHADEVAFFLTNGMSSLIRLDLKAGISPVEVKDHMNIVIDKVLESGLFLSE